MDFEESVDKVASEKKDLKLAINRHLILGSFIPFNKQKIRPFIKRVKSKRALIKVLTKYDKEIEYYMNK